MYTKDELHLIRDCIVEKKNKLKPVYIGYHDKLKELLAKTEKLIVSAEIGCIKEIVYNLDGSHKETNEKKYSFEVGV
jgi:hypothetical protein